MVSNGNYTEDPSVRLQCKKALTLQLPWNAPIWSLNSLFRVVLWYGTGHPWIYPTEGQGCGALMISFMWALTNIWIIIWVADESRCIIWRHCNVTGKYEWKQILIKCLFQITLLVNWWYKNPIKNLLVSFLGFKSFQQFIISKILVTMMTGVMPVTL